MLVVEQTLINIQLPLLIRFMFTFCDNKIPGILIFLGKNTVTKRENV